MSRLEIRPALAHDLTALSHVWSVVYRRGEPYPPEDAPRVADGEWGAEAWLDGNLAGGFWSSDLRLNIAGAVIPSMGVGAVAVLPAWRGQKVADELMRFALTEADARGQVLAALYPYRESYYRRFGYEVAGKRIKIRCPQNRFPAHKPDLPIRQLSPEETPILAGCYQEFAKRLCGTHERTSRGWEQRLGKRTPMIFAVGDPVEAYCWSHMDGNFWEELSFGEVVWSTERGYRNILAVMRGAAENRSAIVWDEPTCSPFLASYLDQGVQMEVHRQAMWRIISLTRYFACYKHPATDVVVTIKVEDPAFAENDRVWRISGNHDGIKVEPCDDAPVATLSIGCLTQLVLGEPSASSLAEAGLLGSAGPALAQLFPARSVYLTEFF